jgi:DNA-binding Lrp family transcriptional regulator
MALSTGDGVPVNVVAKMLHVEASAVTSRSKVLEERGLRTRVVQLSAYRQLGNVFEQQAALDEREFGTGTSSVLSVLASLKQRIEKVRHRAALDCPPTATDRDHGVPASGDTSLDVALAWPPVAARLLSCQPKPQVGWDRTRGPMQCVGAEVVRSSIA